MIRLVIGIAVLALPQANDVLDRAGEAASIVRQCADALGGRERLMNADSITFGLKGSVNLPYQGPAPEAPGSFEYTDTTTLRFVPLLLQVTNGLTGGETGFARTAEFDGDSVSSRGQFARQLRQSPHAVIRGWLDAPHTLVLTDQTETHYVVSGAFHGRLAHAYIHRTSKLLDRIAVPFDDARFGDALAMAEFSDYRERDGWVVPERLRVIEGGSVIIDSSYSEYSVIIGGSTERLPSTDVEAETSESGAEPGTDAPNVERPSEDTFLHRDYGQRVRVLFNTGGPDYHSMAVVSPDGVIVVETPGSVADGIELIERASDLGTVHSIGITHHHGDHSSGAAGAASEERKLVVAEAHRDFFEDMVTARRRLLPFEFSPVESPEIETVPAGGQVWLTDTLVAYDAGPTGHADAQLVFYVPDAKVLFQSDMAVFRWDGSVEAARAQTCRLHAFIRERELDVEVIVGGHGRPGSLADLDRAIALREDGCSDP